MLLSTWSSSHISPTSSTPQDDLLNPEKSGFKIWFSYILFTIYTKIYMENSNRFQCCFVVAVVNCIITNAKVFVRQISFTLLYASSWKKSACELFCSYGTLEQSQAF